MVLVLELIVLTDLFHEVDTPLIEFVSVDFVVLLSFQAVVVAVTVGEMIAYVNLALIFVAVAMAAVAVVNALEEVPCTLDIDTHCVSMAIQYLSTDYKKVPCIHMTYDHTARN